MLFMSYQALANLINMPNSSAVLVTLSYSGQHFSYSRTEDTSQVWLGFPIRFSLLVCLEFRAYNLSTVSLSWQTPQGGGGTGWTQSLQDEKGRCVTIIILVGFDFCFWLPLSVQYSYLSGALGIEIALLR